MGMSHNWALVQKLDLKQIKRTVSSSEPANSDPLLEWLPIDQDVPPDYNYDTEKLDVSFSKVLGKFKISYTKVLI